jgi:hypothetical protein
MQEDLLSALDRGRQTAGDPHALPHLAPEFVLSIPDSISIPFRLRVPVAIAVAEAPYCRLAVSDRNDRAIHIFDLDGNYIRSVFHGGRTRNVTARVLSIGFTAKGELFVLEAGTRRLHNVTNSGKFAGSVVLEPWPGIGTGGRAISAPDGTLFMPSGTAAALESGVPSLIRAWTATGEHISDVGTILRSPDPNFSRVLNEGGVDIRNDTVFLARLADGRLFRFLYDSEQRHLYPVGDTTELPLFYEMPVPFYRPMESLVPGLSPQVNMSRHLSRFVVDPDGNYFFVQATRPSSLDTGQARLVPQTVLSSLTRESRHRAYHVGGPLYGLAAGRERLFAMVLDTIDGHHALDVVAFRNPHSAGPSDCSQ